MNQTQDYDVQGHRLIQCGIILFLLGLFTGLTSAVAENPRMILSSHLEGILNGIFLMLLGLLWPRLNLNQVSKQLTFWLLLYATFANWFATLIAGIWGAGASMPIAALGHSGSPLQEIIINFLLFSLSFAIIVACLFIVWGLRKIKINT